MSDADGIVCLNVKPIAPELHAELKARAARARVPLYAYIGRILTEYLAQDPTAPTTAGAVAASAWRRTSD